MGICKWIRYRGSYCYKTECGYIQGISVRPRQKKCNCGKKIERLNSDEFDEVEKYYQEHIGIHTNGL